MAFFNGQLDARHPRLRKGRRIDRRRIALSRFLALTALLAATLPISIACADEKPAPEGSDASATFAQLDANKDGQLTSDEIPEDQKRLFERLLRTADKNNDGRLSAEEFAAGLKPAQRTGADDSSRGGKGRRGEGRPAPEKIFQRLDANGDGKLTLDEVPEERKERFKPLFARGDKNGDGALDRAEFRDAFAAPPDAPAGGPPEGRGGDAKRFFSRLDKNSDGKITADEVPEERRAFVERLIRRGDKDGDLALSLEEFIAGRPERPGQGKPGQAPPGAENRKRPPQGGPPAGLFMALDVDHDGKLSRDEIAAAADVIRKLDRDGDGAVTLDEIIPARDKSRDTLQVTPIFLRQGDALFCRHFSHGQFLCLRRRVCQNSPTLSRFCNNSSLWTLEPVGAWRVKETRQKRHSRGRAHEDFAGNLRLDAPRIRANPNRAWACHVLKASGSENNWQQMDRHLQ